LITCAGAIGELVTATPVARTPAASHRIVASRMWGKYT
jgi:hypothetical protein